MKKLWMLVLTLALIFTMAGCMRSEDTLVLNADGSGSSTTLLEVKKSAYDEIVKEMGIGQEANLFGDETPTVVTKDGEEYYQIKEETTFASLEELKKALAESYQNVIVTEDSIRFCLGATMTQADYEEAKAVYSQGNVDLDSMLTAKLTIQMPDKIEAVSSKGTIGADGKTATFTMHTADFVNPVEFMVSTAKEETAPTISGVTNNKVYNKPITIRVNDASGIAEAAYRKGSAAAVSFDLTQTLKKNGAYTVTAKDYYGNEAVKTFTIKDTKKPTVSGVKNGKTYIGAKVVKFKDNCGIAKATLNGKKISSGKKISKKEATSWSSPTSTGSRRLCRSKSNDERLRSDISCIIKNPRGGQGDRGDFLAAVFAIRMPGRESLCRPQS